MPQTVIAKIGSRRGIVGPVPLRAVVRIAGLIRNDRDAGAVVVTIVVVGVIIIIVRAVVVGVGVGGEGTADHGTGHRAGEEAAMMAEITAAPAAATIPGRAAAVPGCAAAVPGRAAANPRCRRGCEIARCRRGCEIRGRCTADPRAAAAEASTAAHTHAATTHAAAHVAAATAKASADAVLKAFNLIMIDSIHFRSFCVDRSIARGGECSWPGDEKPVSPQRLDNSAIRWHQTMTTGIS